MGSMTEAKQVQSKSGCFKRQAHALKVPIARQEERARSAASRSTFGYPLSTTSPVERARIVSVPQPSTGRSCSFPLHSSWFSAKAADASFVNGPICALLC